MLDIRTQSQLVDASASIMRWCMTATINVSAASASRGMALWNELIEAANATGGTAPPAKSNGSRSAAPARSLPMPPIAMLASWPLLADKVPATSPLARAWWLGPDPGWGPLAGLSALSRVSLPAWNGWLAQAPTAAASREKTNGASRRNADGGGYSAYRSAGGHAVAQVIMGPLPARANGQAKAAERS